jgi:hypothetical protein
VAAGPGQPLVPGQQGAVEGFGQNDVGGVIGGDVVAQLEGPAPKRSRRRPASDREVPEVGERILRPGGGEPGRDG